MKKVIIFFICIMFIISLEFNFISHKKDKELKENQLFCETDCLKDNWQYGDYLGFDMCNCYNRTVTNCFIVNMDNLTMINFTGDGSNYSTYKGEKICMGW